VLKSAETGELVHAVRVAARGEVYLYPTMARKLVQDYFIRVDGSAAITESLSPREQEILQLLAEGYSSKEIAEKLVVSNSTVHTHRSNLMNKLGLSSRRELIQYARKRGLLRDY
jgi:two-component system response regulator NreC